jgi:nucleotidyltransferase substrate binding protein (TIGR01987 family)
MSDKSPISKAFSRAIVRLEEVLELDKTDITRDSAIKRFEICFDLAWKAIKNYARNEGVECNSPRMCFKTAFNLNLIDYDEKWLKSIEDRNTTSHLYNEKLADQVYQRLPEYRSLFKSLLSRLEK